MSYAANVNRAITDHSRSVHSGVPGCLYRMRPRLALPWLSQCTLSLVIRYPIPAITRPKLMLDGNAATPYSNAVDKSQFAASEWHLLRDEGADGLNHGRGRVVKGLFAAPFGRSVGDVHRLVGVHY